MEKIKSKMIRFDAKLLGLVESHVKHTKSHCTPREFIESVIKQKMEKLK